VASSSQFPLSPELPIALGYCELHYDPLSFRTLSPCSRSMWRSWSSSFSNRHFQSLQWCRSEPVGSDHTPPPSPDYQAQPFPVGLLALWVLPGVAVRATCEQWMNCGSGGHTDSGWTFQRPSEPLFHDPRRPGAQQWLSLDGSNTQHLLCLWGTE
jgi:hypothetical protein